MPNYGWEGPMRVSKIVHNTIQRVPVATFA
jgi:hypothetical protein